MTTIEVESIQSSLGSVRLDTVVALGDLWDDPKCKIGIECFAC
jgi:hypothetical protein